MRTAWSSVVEFVRQMTDRRGQGTVEYLGLVLAIGALLLAVSVQVKGGWGWDWWSDFEVDAAGHLLDHTGLTRTSSPVRYCVGGLVHALASSAIRSRMMAS